MTKSVSGLILSLVDPFSCFPCLFNFSSLKAGTISCFILLSSNWDFHFPQISRILKIDKLSSLLNLIQNLHLSPSRSDSCLRTLSAFGLFSVSSFFSAISAPPSSIRFPQNDLDSSCPFQSLCVSWGNCLEPSPTLDVLQSFNPHRYPRSECFISLPLCCGNPRVLVYSLPIFLEIMGLNFPDGQCQLCLPRKAFDLISLWKSLSPCKTLRKSWTFRLYTLIWAIWKERNQRVFGNIARDLSSVFIWYSELGEVWPLFFFLSFESFCCNFTSILLPYENDQ